MVRYLIKTSEIRSGMVLGENLYNKNGVLLISEGSKLNTKNVEVILNTHKEAEISIKLNKVKGRSINAIIESNSVIIPNANYRDKDLVRENFKKVSLLLKDTFDGLRVNKSSHEFMKKIRLAIKDIKENLKLNITVLNELLEKNRFDEYLYRHSVNVAVLSHFIGQWLGLSEPKLDKLIMAGLLHDIGKCRIAPEILNKPARLTMEEFEEIKKHSMYSYFTLVGIGYTDNDVLQAVSLHHEKEDGSGYPFGLHSEEIPLFAKILTVADIFDAMTSNRAYKKRELPFKVIEMFQSEAFGKLDPKVVMVFINKFSEYYLGTQVILDNGKVGKIIRLNNYDITKPLIALTCNQYLDISKERNISIVDFYTKNPRAN